MKGVTGWKKLSLAVAALGVWGVTHNAYAFRCSRVYSNQGASLHWTSRSVGWFLDPAILRGVEGTEAEVRAEVIEAYQVWQNVDCSDMALPLLGEQSGLRPGFSETGVNRNVVVWVGSGWSYDDSSIAITTNAYDTATGEIVDSDIELNGQEFDFAVVGAACAQSDGTMDLRNALTHEVGHLLGLDHPPEVATYAEVTMFASAPPCETRKRSLENDDIDGVCFIYPRDEATQPCYPSDLSFQVEEEGTGDGAGLLGCQHRRSMAPVHAWVSLALVLGAAALRRRRDRQRRARVRVRSEHSRTLRRR